MNTCHLWRVAAWFALAHIGGFSVGLAQTAPAPSAAAETTKLEKFVVTGSLIKRIEGESALPVQTITIEEMEQQGIASAEQLISMLNINGNGLDNLASNADVVAGATRGNNGATSANLRGQGSNATLILLNGRRIASHGLNGGVVDLNSIPFAAIQRVETLKDGASAIYGTDAVGGVINFILRTDYRGLTANAATDITEDGGGNIHRFSLLGGIGDLEKDKFNLMASFSVSDHRMLRGNQRDFVNTFQPDRGLSVDTRGTPIATLFTLTTLQTALSRDNIDNTGRNTGPLDPANPNLRVTGINIVDLPTGPGYAGLDGMGPYDEVLWASPGAKYGSAWDTGRAAVLQQPVRNTNLVARGTFKLGAHRLTAEAIFGRSESTKSFSANQISSVATGNTTLPNGLTFQNPFSNLRYPSTGPDYNRVFNSLVAYFPALEVNRGLPLAFRWRALPTGNREIATESNTRRLLVAAEGPVGFLSEWEYRVGASQASSKSESELVNGYFYTIGFADLINRGILNPFSYTQTPEALQALAGVMARGVKLYDGEFTTEQADATFSGPLLKLREGTVMAAAGVDVRVEKYVFNGDQRSNANDPAAQVFNAPFDNTLATAGTLKRTIKAAFAELQIPVLKGFDLNPAVRTDHYTGFGRSTNPKVTLRYAPTEKFLVRGTYSTGFRVPTFKQMFDPIVETTYAGNDIADPASGRPVGPDNPAIKPVIFTGGKRDLQPEEADMFSAGIVFAPTSHLSGNIDWWSIEREGTIQSFGVTTLIENYTLFPERFLRSPTGELVGIDNRWVNAGETKTKGIEVGLRGDMDAGRGKLSGGFDLSYLLEKKSRLIPSAPFSASEVGRFTRASDIGIKWKHTAFVGYRRGNWTGLLQHIFRGHYVDAMLPGVANGSVRPPNWDRTVDSYSTFNGSVTYRGFKNFTVIAGIKNLLNTDPPFSAAYDTNTGAGSSWEPRVADPRGRSYTLQVQYKFF